MYMKFQEPFPVCLLMLYSFALKSEKSQLHINDRAGLQRRVHVQGSRLSYGNFVVDKFHCLQVSVGSNLSRVS